MLYVSMFDEVDEGTAIFKCAPNPPDAESPSKFVGFEEGVPNDHYLWLTGKGGQLIRGEIPSTPELYLKLDPKSRNR